MSRNQLVDDILKFMPLMHKKIFREVHKRGLSKQQMGLMFTIKNHGGKPMKFFCEKLMISKPNLTTAINKLINDGFVERKNDDNDRRVINLFITDEGIEFLDYHMKLVKGDLLKKLEVLSDEDIETLLRNFEEMHSIFNKLI